MTQAKGTVSEEPTTNMRLTWRTSAVSSASGPTMKPGVSHSESTGSPNASHNCKNRAALSALSASMAPAPCMGLLAMTPIARPSIRANAVTSPGANDGRSSRTDPSSASSSSARRMS